jgi:hypothetical protein
MLMHNNPFITKWMVGIKMRMASMCKEGFVMTIITLMYNDAATDDILESKRKFRLARVDIEQQSQMLTQIPWYSVRQRLIGRLKIWRDSFKARIDLWRYDPSSEAMNRCLGCPEFEFMEYLHKLTERISAWRKFPDKHLSFLELPAEFVELKGELDAPHAEYEYLCRILEMADSFIPAEMQRTMFALMLSEKMGQTRPMMPSHAE